MSSPNVNKSERGEKCAKNRYPVPELDVFKFLKITGMVSCHLIFLKQNSVTRLLQRT